MQNYGFVSLLYSISDKPLELWSKHVSQDGKIRRIHEIELNERVLEITGPHETPVPTNITCPPRYTEILNVKLPIFVLIMKKLEQKFKIEFQVQNSLINS